MSKKELSPQDKLLQAVYGKPLSEVTEADIELLRQKYPDIVAKHEAEMEARLEAELKDLQPLPNEKEFLDHMHKKWDELLAKNKPTEE